MNLEQYKQDYDCPTCNKGKLVLRQVSNNTKALYSCNFFESKGEGKFEKCEQTIWLNQFDRDLTPEQIDKLINEGSTGIDTFKSKKGNEFKAEIVLFENSTKVVFQEEEEELVDNIDCPKCGSEIYKKGSYYCEGYKDKSCQVYIPKIIANHFITEEEALELLRGNVTHVITDFVSNKGNQFSARLVLNEDTLKVEFDNTICECPNIQCDGYILDFPKVYKCSRNDDTENSCNLLIWKEMNKAKISVDILKQLIENGRTKNPLNMISKKGNEFKANLILSSDQKITYEFINTKK